MNFLEAAVDQNDYSDKVNDWLYFIKNNPNNLPLIFKVSLDTGFKSSITNHMSIFDFLNSLSKPKRLDLRLYYYLHKASAKYCESKVINSRFSFSYNPIKNIQNVTWDLHLLYRLFDCWILLFEREDRYCITKIISNLRENQKELEKEYLKDGSKTNALRLVAFYHWAKVTEIIAEYFEGNRPDSTIEQLDRHFKNAIRAANLSKDVSLESTLRWLHIVGKIMID